MTEHRGRCDVGVIMGLSDLYRRNLPEFTAELARGWKTVMSELLAGRASFVSDTAHTLEEFERAVRACELRDCRSIILLPMAYTFSGAVIPALRHTRLPIVVVSSCRDGSLPDDITGDDLLANQALHGVQDLCNGLMAGNTGSGGKN